MNNPIFFTEQHKYSTEELTTVIGENNVKELLQAGWLEQSKEQWLTFKYVGMIIAGQKVVCVNPKYMESAAINVPHFVQVLRVLEKYRQTTSNLPHLDLDTNGEEEQLNVLSVVEYLVADFILHGYYHKPLSEIRLNGNGERVWDVTVDNVDPYIVRGRPLYFDTYNRENTSDESSQILKIHKWAIYQCCHYFGFLLNYSSMDIDETYTDVSDIGSLEYIRALLDKELQSVYNDRHIKLIKALITFLSLAYSVSDEKVVLYGTSHFHTVWEAVCSEAFGNDRDRFLKSIPQPRWVEFTTKRTSLSEHTFTPDIIRAGNFAGETFFIILDAKYYRTEFCDGKVRHEPGVGDVAKQLLYEKALTDVDESKRAKLRSNIFVFPYLGEHDLVLLGIAQMEFVNISPIILLRLSADHAYNRYLRSERLSDEQIIALIKQSTKATLDIKNAVGHDSVSEGLPR